MGRGLSAAYPAYAEALEEALEETDRHLERPLRELLFAAPGSEEAELLGDTTWAQPALFVTHVALHRLLGSRGLAPELLLGHSVGEISAAHLAGVLSLPDAAKLICARGALMGALPQGGAMLAIGASEAEVAAALEGSEAELSIAAINSPTSTVISGTEQAIEAQEEAWSERGAKTKRLAVSHAFHSPLIEPMLEDFAEVVRRARLRRAQARDRLQPLRRAARRRAGDRPRLLGLPGARGGALRRRARRPSSPRAPRP